MPTSRAGIYDLRQRVPGYGADGIVWTPVEGSLDVQCSCGRSIVVVDRATFRANCHVPRSCGRADCIGEPAPRKHSKKKPNPKGTQS